VPTVAESCARFAARLRWDDIPPEVRQAAKLHLLDALGCGIAAHGTDAATECRTVVEELGGIAEASVIGGTRLPAASAALANGTLCQALDFDDTHTEAGCHVSAVIGPVVLAEAEACGADGRELLTAFVVGSEISTRVGIAVIPGLETRGLHATPICGIFGGVAACGRLLGDRHRVIVHALGVAGSMASGISATIEDGSQTKPIHSGWAAHAAVLAARLARRGATGPSGVFEGRFGILQALLDGEFARDLGRQVEDLGERWETLNIAFKPYPACHYIHACLEAVEALRKRRDIQIAQIEAIAAQVPEPVIPFVVEPIESKVAPRTPYDAKFSLPYSVAAMLVHGRVDLSTYTEVALRDEAVRALARRVRYEAREFPTYPASFPGAIRLIGRLGEVGAAEVVYQRGSARNPVSETEIREKFRRNASLGIAADSVSELENAILELDRGTDVAAALAPVRSASAELSL